MKSVISSDIEKITEAAQYHPAVSVIMPFEPKMVLKSELVHSLKIATDRVASELKEKYPTEMGCLVIQKLRAIIHSLNYNSFKKSIAIYVSPVFEKVLYLDIHVTPKIIVGDSFEIRDLVYNKKVFQKFLVLLLSAKESRIYLGNATTLTRIISNTPQFAYAAVNDIAEKVSNFSDKSKRKENLMDKFLHDVDNRLDIILNAYHLPLFVLGTERVLGHFKSFTRHDAAIIEYVPGNYEESSFDQVREILQPYIADWEKIKQKNLLKKLEEAAGKKKLAIGMQDVWEAAVAHRGRLLAVEKDYIHKTETGTGKELAVEARETYNRFSNIKDVVDDTIEKVLEDGGEVEFVDKDVLKNFNHIALVKYY